MKKTNKLKELREVYKTVRGGGEIFTFKGKLVEVVGIAEGKSIIMEVISDRDKDKCPHCNAPVATKFSVLEHSPYFQVSAEALPEDRLLKQNEK